MGTSPRIRSIILLSAMLIALLLALRATAAHAAGPAAPSPPVKCTRSVARTLIPQTKVGAAFLKKIGDSRWSIVQLGCLKLMGGTERDMVAMASCCTAAAPTPLFIFRPTAHGWVTTFARGKPLIAEIAHLGSALIEKRPIYHKGTPLCCPRGYTYWSVRWIHRHWVIARAKPPAPA